jgi:hypothetical protein
MDHGLKHVLPTVFMATILMMHSVAVRADPLPSSPLLAGVSKSPRYSALNQGDDYSSPGTRNENAMESLERTFGVRHTDRERKRKTIELLGGADSTITPSVFGGGTGVIGYYLTPNVVVDVGLRLALGIRPFNFSNLFDKQVAYEGTGALRVFFSKSLYGAFGGGIGQYEAEHKEETSPDFTSWKESVTIWRPYLGFGNQWHWKSWTIMIEWLDIGYYVGLSNVKNNLPPGTTGERAETSETSTLSKIPGSLSIGSKLLMGFSF